MLQCCVQECYRWENGVVCVEMMLCRRALCDDVSVCRSVMCVIKRHMSCVIKHHMSFVKRRHGRHVTDDVVW